MFDLFFEVFSSFELRHRFVKLCVRFSVLIAFFESDAHYAPRRSIKNTEIQDNISRYLTQRNNDKYCFR